MNKPFFSKALITAALCVMMVSAFMTRLQVYVRPQLRTIDEIVYMNLGLQVSRHISHYNSIGVGKHLASRGKYVPDYMLEPLFKHPPLFSFLIALAFKVFGDHFQVVPVIVPLISAIGLIPLTYLLGVKVFNRKVGCVAAFLLYLDPISIICSQKVWLDTTLALFTVLGIYFFVRALKDEGDHHFLFGAAAVGLAVNTKYPGLLPIAIMLAYAVLYRRDLLINKMFLISLLIPFLMLVPWLTWNLMVYGGVDISRHEEWQLLVGNIGGRSLFLLPLAGLLYLFYKKIKGDAVQTKVDEQKEDPESRRKLMVVSYVFALGFLVILVPESVRAGVTFNHLPFSSWMLGAFTGAAPTFYFGRLIEFSLIYVFAFVHILTFKDTEEPAAAFLRINATLILLFYVAWGNFQSRYILSCIPLLIILGVHAWDRLLGQWSRDRFGLWGFCGQAMLYFTLGFIVTRCLFLNIAYNVVNDMCYF